MAVQNIKKKYLMCQIPIKMLKKSAQQLKFTEIKDLFINRVQKNYMYVANAAILALDDITSGYVFLLRLVNTFIVDTGDYYRRC